MLHAKSPIKRKLWVITLSAIICWVAVTAFQRNIMADDSNKVYEQLKIFSDVLEIIQDKYVDEVDQEELVQNAIKGMVQSLDPHSDFLLLEDFEDLKIDTQGEFTGVGIHIAMQDNFVTVIAPIEGTPAEKAGIQPMDRIIAVDGIQVTDLREAVKLMRGPKDTKVVLTIYREGTPEPLEFDITRALIPIRTVRAALLQPDYGYIRISNFTANTTTDFKDALEQMEKANGGALKGLVFDLRSNGGGLLPESISISEIFLSDKPIVSTKGRKVGEQIFKAPYNANARTYPLAVLINGGTASASEIVAGALKDNGRAVLVGTPSFGKGSVQMLDTLRDGSGLKITIALYYTPSGRSIQAEGIAPDIDVPYEKLDLEKPKPKDFFYKEKDLAGHLEADNQPEDKPATTPETKEWAGYNMNDTDMDILKSDNQIMRGLEALVVINVFQQP